MIAFPEREISLPETCESCPDRDRGNPLTVGAHGITVLTIFASSAPVSVSP